MSTSQELVIVHMDNEPRIDSRLVAKELGIEHESFMKTLSTYSHELEELGSLRFRVGVKSGRRGGTPSKYVMLNEDQVFFAAMVSRNTRRVINFRLKLIKVFAEARKQTQR